MKGRAGMRIQPRARGESVKTGKFDKLIRVVPELMLPAGVVLDEMIGPGITTRRAGMVRTTQGLRPKEIAPAAARSKGGALPVDLGLESRRTHLASADNPFLERVISRVDPPPHQSDAVHNRFLKAGGRRWLPPDKTRG
jgi:hypothetical protein